MISNLFNFARLRSAFICIVLSGTFITANSQVDDTIYIDLGSDASISLNGWNNITQQRTGAIADLVNISGINTGIAVAVSDQFNGVNTNGMAADPSLDIPLTGSSDSFFW